MSSIGYQIFTTENEADEKEAAIRSLLGIPNISTKTTKYVKKIKHYNQDLWYRVVENVLVAACANMTPSERLAYYDSDNLKTAQYLIDKGWFPPDYD